MTANKTKTRAEIFPPAPEPPTPLAYRRILSPTAGIRGEYLGHLTVDTSADVLGSIAIVLWVSFLSTLYGPSLTLGA